MEMLISVVIPIYNEEAILPTLLARLQAAMAQFIYLLVTFRRNHLLLREWVAAICFVLAIVGAWARWTAI